MAPGASCSVGCSPGAWGAFCVASPPPRCEAMRACGSARRPPAWPRTWGELHKDGGKRGQTPARSCRGQLGFGRLLSVSHFCRCSPNPSPGPALRCGKSQRGGFAREKVTRGLGAPSSGIPKGHRCWGSNRGRQGCSWAVHPHSEDMAPRGYQSPETVAHSGKTG